MAEVEIKVNHRNVSFVEGYVTELDYKNEKRKLLRFTLRHLNIDRKGGIHSTDYPVIIKDDRAERLSKWLKNGDLVEVECKSRFDGKWSWIGVHITSTDPIFRKIDVEIKGEKNEH